MIGLFGKNTDGYNLGIRKERNFENSNPEAVNSEVTQNVPAVTNNCFASHEIKR